jgi:hypothetical protein
MTDCELLELAAKAAGIVYDTNDIYVSAIDGQIQGISVPTGKSPISYRTWNPLTDDGDALRLAVKLQLDICQGDSVVSAECYFEFGAAANEPKTSDPYAATRRAIVRAAAEIGRAMP